MAHEIFICYRSQDTDGEALLIASHLRTIFGEGHVFWAPASIRGGQDFVVESTSKAEGAWIVLAIIGPNWGCDLAEGSPVVVAELRAAISREVRIFPVLVRRESLEDVPLPDLAFLETTDGKQWPTGLNHHELDGEACRLAHRLVQAEPRLQQFTNHSWGGWPVTLDLAPHPEWSIEVEEGDHLFGRDELDELERRLLEPGGDLRFVAVHGEGGLGKSTVAEALWRRAKRRTGLDGSFDLLAWISLKVAPRSATSVAECIRESLPVEFARRGRALDDLGRLVSTKRCLMVIDNLETTMEARGKFSDEYADFDELLAVLEAETSRSVAIVTSRALPKVVEAGPGVKVVKLPALDAISAVKVFRRDHMSLVESYGSDSWLRVAGKLWGNPYLCVLVARFISAKIESGEYGKGPENWLEDPAVPEKVDDIYRWHWDQFEKAGASGRFEREILLWLTINRDPMSKEELLHDLWSPDSKKRFDTSRDGLDARFPIQTSEEESSGRRVLTVHSYILDFSVERVVDISNDELSRRFGVSLGLGRLFRDQVVEEVSAQLQMGLDEIRSEVGNALATPGPTGVVLIDHCLVKAA
nr:TIR domain-containing protein [Deltaproteobacteria bacterium]